MDYKVGTFPFTTVRDVFEFNSGYTGCECCIVEYIVMKKICDKATNYVNTALKVSEMFL